MPGWFPSCHVAFCLCDRWNFVEVSTNVCQGGTCTWSCQGRSRLVDDIDMQWLLFSYHRLSQRDLCRVQCIDCQRRRGYFSSESILWPTSCQERQELHVAKKDKSYMRMNLGFSRRPLGNKKIDQWTLIALAINAQLKVTINDWTVSHMRVNTRPSCCMSFEEWIKELGYLTRCLPAGPSCQLNSDMMYYLSSSRCTK